MKIPLFGSKVMIFRINGPNIRMSTLTVVFIVALALASRDIAVSASQTPPNDGGSSENVAPNTLDPRRIPRTVTVYKEGLPHEFTLTRAAEASSPLTALRTKIQQRFRDTRFKQFYTMDGKLLEPFALLPENSKVVVQKTGDLWYWPSVQVGHSASFDVEPGRSLDIVTLNHVPRVFLVANFASNEECEYVISSSRQAGALVESGVTLHSDHDYQKNESRTSKNVRFANGSHYNKGDAVFDALLARASKIAQLPVEWADPQIVHYDVGEHFNAHYDYLKLPDRDTTTAQRIITILLYLNDVKDGGETIFPATSAAFIADPAAPLNASLCASSYEFLRQKPKKGQAVVFYNLLEAGHVTNAVDPTSMHAGCPLQSGEKWAVNYWFYNRLPSINMNDHHSHLEHDQSSFDAAPTRGGS